MKEFAPEQMDENEIREFIVTNFSDVVKTKNKGLIMKSVMSELKGKADGKLINQVVADLCK
ncbi:MAG: GatB/YqeY domain-containing protein [Oscillospiraceae bacterium]